jgi:hypothetical protein
MVQQIVFLQRASWAHHASLKACYPFWLSFLTTFNISHIFAQSTCRKFAVQKLTATNITIIFSMKVVETCYFFCVLCVSAQVLTKFHCPCTKTFCSEGFEKDRTKVEDFLMTHTVRTWIWPSQN